MAVKNPSFFTDNIDQGARDKVSRAIDSLRLTVAGGKLEEPKLVDNVIYLSAGSFPFFASTKNGTSISGNTSSVAGMSTAGRIDARGIRFTETVTIGVASVARFSGCTFDKQVQVTSGGKAVFTDCAFVENVNNAGVVADVGIVGCTRQGAAHVNCSIVYEV